MEKEPWRRNHGGVIMGCGILAVETFAVETFAVEVFAVETFAGRDPGGSRRDLGGIREAPGGSGRDLGVAKELLWSHMEPRSVQDR